LEEIKLEIDLVSKYQPKIERIFLADGDALNVETEKLVEILDYLNLKFKGLKRISCYAMPKNLIHKKEAELERLRDRGLSVLYVGIESGNDVLLQKVTKGATSSMIIESCKKATDNKFTLSCMIILGLEGRAYTDAHIADTARVVSQISPQYLAALNLQLDETVLGEFMSKFKAPFSFLTDLEILDELNVVTRPWAVKPEGEVRAALAREAIDVLFYFIELMIFLRVDSTTVLELYEEKWHINMERIEKGVKDV